MWDSASEYYETEDIVSLTSMPGASSNLNVMTDDTGRRCRCQAATCRSATSHMVSCSVDRRGQSIPQQHDHDLDGVAVVDR